MALTKEELRNSMDYKILEQASKSSLIYQLIKVSTAFSKQEDKHSKAVQELIKDILDNQITLTNNEQKGIKAKFKKHFPESVKE